MVIKTYPVEHFPESESLDTVADWTDKLSGLSQENMNATHLRIIWTEEKLSEDDIAKLAEEGYTLYVTDVPLHEEDGPGFAHSMVIKRAAQS